MSLVYAIPITPALDFLCTINLTTGTYIDIGTITQGPISGHGLAIPIMGGTFAGPRGLNGTVAAIGADWSLTAEDDTWFRPDGTLVLQTSDGANIVYRDMGYAPFTYASFQTGFESYSWLNTVVGVARIAQESYGASMEVFQLL